MERATTVPVAMARRRPHKRRIGLVVVVAVAVQIGVVAPSSATTSGHGSTRGNAPEFDDQPVTATSAPSITIVEDAVPNAAQDFPFTGCQGASCSVFALDDDADPDLPNTVSASGLTAGTYTITQAPGVNHWILDDIFCDTGENVDVENRTVTITLGATEDVTCTFLNRSPSIRITEDALPDAPQDFSFTGCQGASCSPFALDDDGDPALANSVTGSGLAPGTYTITQAATANWSLDALSCTTGEEVDLVNRRVTITLESGEFAKCTFTSRTAGIQVVQDTIPDDAQDFGYTGCLGSGCGHFTLDDDSDPALANSVTGTGLAAGIYTITQDITPGFELVYIGCSDGDPSNRRLVLYVEPNQPSGPCRFVNRPTPPPLTNVAQISVGENTTCARLTSGEVRCWGWNSYGLLGTGSSDEYLSIPTAVSNPDGTGPLTDVVQVSVGSRHACAVLQNGEGRCWGANWTGQLGNGTTDTYATRPVVVLNPSGTGPLTGIAQISAGSNEQTCARLTNGEARCWGYNYQGALGDGTTTSRALPVVVSNPDGTGPLTDVVQISIARHACARLSNGEGRCWGPGGGGQLGNGSTESATRPVVVLDPSGTGPLTGIAQISAGEGRTCARVGRQARCWGSGYGLPVVVLDASGEAPLTNVAEITTAAFGRSCVRLLNGEARCWGFSERLGNGTREGSELPVVVSNPDGTGPLTDVAQISTGAYHSCARLSNGEGRCWGANWSGQLGNGTPNGDIPGSDRSRPAVIISA